MEGHAPEAALAGLADWSPWLPLAAALPAAPRLPGVYLARERSDGPLVYVGMAGERRGQGLRGRLTVYSRGKAAVSGLGEAAMDRALADPEWVADRLAELRAGRARRTSDWARAALGRVDLHVCWATSGSRTEAEALERAALAALAEHELWNRLRR